MKQNPLNTMPNNEWDHFLTKTAPPGISFFEIPGGVFSGQRYPAVRGMSRRWPG